MHPQKLDTFEVHILWQRKGKNIEKHSPEFKLSVIMDMRENHLGIMETERKY